MTTDELRQRFLKFFASKGHKIYPSDSLVPKDDPTLLFTSAGMNQFKQEFLSRPAKFSRRATCQRCLRTDDLDKVGKTNFHHTFFEMLGNFSFGDYFKNEAIGLAWEFVTKELNLPKERLWVSVYQEDEEAYKIWKDKIAVSPEKIVKLGAKENFWPSNAPEEGPDGPCGPCSEIFYDLGEAIGCGRSECSPACSCGRFVEVWNLVFTQFVRKGKNKLQPLASKNIDTGMGLERIAAVLQGVTNNFEIDIFKPITGGVIRLTALGDKPNPAQYSARNAIADHIRAITFAIAEGIVPSNDERGYVVRKLIRRAVWHGRTLGIKKIFLYKIVPIVAGVMKAAYPEVEKKREDIARVVLAEERRFHRTLERAMKFAEEIIAALKREGRHKLPGEEMFRLYDTYGLPEEMLKKLTSSKGLELDEEGFTRELQLRRSASRKASVIEEGVFVGTLASEFNLKPSKFVGEKTYSVKTTVKALFRDNQPVKEAREGEQIKIVLQSSPFYAEAGGQLGDTGIIKNKNTRIEISNTRKAAQTIIHLGKITDGAVKLNDRVEAQIDVQRRKAIACNHSATHLLQAALRRVLGEHVRQAGSWVGPDRLRFDFSHFQALTRREIERVEELVNNEIKENNGLEVLKMSYERSQKMGALAFFGEKYQEQVRVVKIGDISMELCGGSHISSTGEIEIFRIISESSVASGIRRIEAQTAGCARETIKQKEEQFKEIAHTFGGSREELPERIEGLLRRIKELGKRLDSSRMTNFKSRIDKIVSDAQEVSGVKIIAQEIKSADMELLRLMADLLRQKAPSSLVLLASLREGKVLMICALSKDLPSRGLDAVKIIHKAAEDIDGSGGGRADFAQAGGTNPQGINKALMRVKEIVEEELGQ